MKHNKKAGLSICIGKWNDKKWRGEALVVLYKKSQAYLRADLLLQKYGHIYLRVTYNKKENYYNDGIYYTISDFKQALAQFVEQPLLNYLDEA